jgi:hypothetical protein
MLESCISDKGHQKCYLFISSKTYEKNMPLIRNRMMHVLQIPIFFPLDTNFDIRLFSKSYFVSKETESGV